MITPAEDSDLIELAATDSGHIARGLGRSYGDAAQLAGGTVVDMTAMTGVRLDAGSGLVTAFGGTSLGTIIDTVVPAGWFLPVTPGTRQVTVGGAIAADVHGKNHHRDGSFGQYVDSIDLVTGDGSRVTATPGSDVFAATIGGMGLTGTITRASFRLTPVDTDWMFVDTRKGDDLDSVMDLLADSDDRHRYSVAWVDLSGTARGRGVVSAAEHAGIDATVLRPRLHKRSGRVEAPAWLPRLVTGPTVALFNQAWFSAAPRAESGRLESLDAFFYPLDRIGSWNRLYGRLGFLQYQFVVPNGEETTLTKVVSTLAGCPTPVALAVLKRMGPSAGGLLSFPVPGWTLAVDLPLGDPDLATTLDECDRAVAAAGGRVYLAKDSRLKADVTEHMYPELARWREIRARLDPGGALRSNLSERLKLTG